MGLFSMWAESLTYDYEISNACTRYQSSRSTCKKCIEACPLQAISMGEYLPKIDNDLCTQCGKCLAACPVQAIAGILPSRTIEKEYLLALEEEAPTAKELLMYYKKGIKRIYCDNELNENWNQEVEKANKMLELMGEQPFSITKEEIEAEEIQLTRRDLFLNWKYEIKSFARELTPAKWRFNQEDLDLSKYYLDYQFSDIILDASKCTFCKACQRLCQKNCFQITEEEFIISNQSCSSCGLCEDICPEKALTITEKISQKTDQIFPIYTKTCATCNQTFQTLNEKEQTCVPCKKRADFLPAK